MGVRYLISGLEEGEHGTHHLQGFAIFNKPVRMSQIKKVLGKRVHLEVARARDSKAANYCAKDQTYFEYGDFGTTQGKRSDLLVLRDSLKRGVDDAALLDDDATAGSFFKYQRGISAARIVYDTPKPRNDVSVTLYFGAPGTGKSSSAARLFPEAYWKDNTKWWQNYKGETTVIWDEFSGASCTPSEFNKIFDRYPYTIEVKGGSVPLRGTNLIIISNFLPELWWDPTKSKVCTEAVTRRIHAVHWFRKYPEPPDVFLTFQSWADARRGTNFNAHLNS